MSIKVRSNPTVISFRGDVVSLQELQDAVDQYPSAEHLVIEQGKLTSAVINQIARLDHLRLMSLKCVDLQELNFTAIPHGCTSLRTLMLWDCMGVTTALTSLSGAIAVESLYVDGCDLTVDARQSIERLPSLHGLSLRRIPLTSEDVSWIARTGKIEHLILEDTECTDEMICELTKLLKLTDLWISNTAISDKGIHCIAENVGSTMSHLRISRTQVTVECIPDICKMRSLKNLLAENTAIAQANIPGFKSWPQLPGVFRGG